MEPPDLIGALQRATERFSGEMLAFLARIVNMDSPTHNKTLVDRVADVLQAEAESLGFSARRDPQPDFGDNRIFVHEPAHRDPSAPRILIVGHCDTVYPAGTVETRPFRTEGDRAFGPGVNDMKGGLTVALFALRILKETLGDIPTPLTFIVNTDEEKGSPASRKIIMEQARNHDLTLVFEPGGDNQTLKIARRGVGVFHFDVSGVEAHAGSEPEKGRNAIVEMAHKALALDALNDLEKGTSVTVGVISGGTEPYVVPARCRIGVDARVVTLAEQRRLQDAFREIADTAEIAGTVTALSGGFHRPPMEADATSMAYIQQFVTAAQSVGFPLGLSRSGASSDANLTAAVGTPTIDGLGPHGGRPHSPDEYIETPTLGAKCKAVAAFLAQARLINRSGEAP